MLGLDKGYDDTVNKVIWAETGNGQSSTDECLISILRECSVGRFHNRILNKLKNSTKISKHSNKGYMLAHKNTLQAKANV